MTALAKISLVLSDVDGTLVTKQKEVTPAARAAVDGLRAKGIKFAIASSRPVRGLRMVRDALDLDTPMSGFNGGRMITPAGEVIRNLKLPEGVPAKIVQLLTDMGLSIWVYAGDDWYLTDPLGHRVDHELKSIGYDPIVVFSFAPDVLAETVKIVGVHTDHDLVMKAEEAVQTLFGEDVSATRSQPFYLDITDHGATKGEVLKELARYYNVPLAETVTIGDMMNDVLMFRESGYSIAMGNADDGVKAQATVVTDSNNDEGFAKAMQRFLG